MTDITSTSSYTYGDLGQLKVISIVTPGTADTGDTIDLNSDVAHGRGAKMMTVLNTYIQDDAGLLEECTFDPATGILTLGTMTAAGIHNILVWGV